MTSLSRRARRTSSIPAADEDTTVLLEEAQTSASDVALLRGAITLPDLAPQPTTGYCQRHIDIRLSPTEAVKARRLLEALQREGTCLTETGRPIRSLGDMVKWLMQQIP